MSISPSKTFTELLRLSPGKRILKRAVWTNSQIDSEWIGYLLWTEKYALNKNSKAVKRSENLYFLSAICIKKQSGLLSGPTHIKKGCTGTLSAFSFFW